MRGRELAERALAATAQSKALAHRVADLADRTAMTEDAIAESHGNLTGNEVDTDRRRRAAEEARDFAAHERRESKRWRAVAEADGSQVAEGPAQTDPEAVGET